MEGPVSTYEFGAPYVAGTAAVSNKVLRTKPGPIMDWWAVTSSAAVYLMVLDVAALPADGSISSTPLIDQVYLPAGSSFSKGYDPPVSSTVGVVLAASTTAYPTLTASATCTFGGRVR